MVMRRRMNVYEPKVSTSITLPPDLLTRGRAYAQEQGVAFSHLVEDSLRAYLAQQAEEMISDREV